MKILKRVKISIKQVFMHGELSKSIYFEIIDQHINWIYIEWFTVLKLGNKKGFSNFYWCYLTLLYFLSSKEFSFLLLRQSLMIFCFFCLYFCWLGVFCSSSWCWSWQEISRVSDDLALLSTFKVLKEISWKINM